MSFTSIELEQYLAGTLDGARARAIEEAAAGDAKLRAFLEERRALEKQLALDPRVKSFAALTEQAREKPRFGFLFAGAGALAAAAGVLLWVIAPPDPSVLVKGGVTVRALRLRGEKTERVASGAALLAGDRIRLMIEDPEGGHPAVLWADDRGHARTLLSPEELGLMRPPSLTLPESFEIGRESGEERIYVILCNRLPDIDRWPAEIAHEYDERWIPPEGCRLGLFEWRVE